MMKGARAIWNCGFDAQLHQFTPSDSPRVIDKGFDHDLRGDSTRLLP
jgi:hypothetical protein